MQDSRFELLNESEGASPRVVKLMMEAAAGEIAVKGSGCIRTREHFLQLIDMGIDRMGVGFRSTPVVLDCTPEEAKQL